MARLYADENFPRPAVEALRRLGHDVLTALEAGAAGRGVPDEDVLDAAWAEQRALVTLNRKDFIHLHRSRPEHGGIVVCASDPDFEALAGRIHTALAETPEHPGVLIRVQRPPGS